MQGVGRGQSGVGGAGHCRGLAGHLCPSRLFRQAVHPVLRELRELGSEPVVLHLDTLPWALCALGEGLGVLKPWQVWECEAQSLGFQQRMQLTLRVSCRAGALPGIGSCRLRSLLLSSPQPPRVFSLRRHLYTHPCFLSAPEKPPDTAHFPGPSCSALSVQRAGKGMHTSVSPDTG